MKFETFINRIDNGKGVTYPYKGPNLIGGINIWKNGDIIVLIWEECAPEDFYNEYRYTKDIVEHFSSTSELLGYLEKNKISPTHFQP